MPRLILVLLCYGIIVFSGPAATFSFDGYIERAPESYNDYHTLDFIFLQVLSPSTLSVTGSAGTLLDFNFGLYVPASVIDGRQRLNLASGLTFVPISDNSFQIQCAATPGSYIIGVDPSGSDWDQNDGVVGYFGTDGSEESGSGSYHLDIVGDFSITKIREGDLPNSTIPEPSSFTVGLFGILMAFVARRH